MNRDLEAMFKCFILNKYEIRLCERSEAIQKRKLKDVENKNNLWVMIWLALDIKPYHFSLYEKYSSRILSRSFALDMASKDIYHKIPLKVIKVM